MPGKNAVQSRYARIMEGLGVWTSFYRQNPHRLAIDYLGMHWMRPFQQMLLCMILRFNMSMIIASRGMGKTMIVAAAICVKCILYPRVQVVIAAGNRGQSINVISKIIDEFMTSSPNLRAEIEQYSTLPSGAFIKWRNGSMVKVVTARDSARSARAHWVVCDEFVQIKKTVIDGVLRKFKAGQRTPEFFNNPAYRDYPKEPNCETYISSAYYKYHYSWGKFQSFFKSMVKGESYICAGFPYQLPVSEGYYPEEQIREEMQESDWDSVLWSMEMESLFWGEASNAFYSFSDMDAARVLDIPLYPPDLYRALGDPKLRAPVKQNGEIRIIGMDVATQGGARNDNTCFAVLQLLPAKSQRYIRSLVYMETLNGGHTFDQAVRMRQLFDDFEADYAVIDTNGVGIGVFDSLVREIGDEERGVVYRPWTCMNDPKMAERCRDPSAAAVIYSVKATPQWNSDAAVLLRDGIRRGAVRLLINETDANERWQKNKCYRKLDAESQALLQAPYYQTSAFINETINLSYDMVGGKIRVEEQGNMRKDRYSAVSYANMLAAELERRLLRPKRAEGFGGIIALARPANPYAGRR